MIVHLNGWPGAGKRTIGEALSTRLGARFVHNHVLHDVAIACAGLRDPDRWPLYEAVRTLAYDALARRSSSEIFVMTNALCDGASRERDAWRHVVELAIARGVPLIPVVLDVAVEENVRRLESADRRGRKLVDPAPLHAMQATDRLQRPAVPELLEIDVTSLSAEDAAARIQARLDGLRGTLEPASRRHLDLAASNT